jgi:hypothetical protein
MTRTTHTTQLLAIAYAETLVAYYEAKHSEGIDRDTNVRRAYNDLCDAQNALAEYAEAVGRERTL